jgi:hypothetical protein
MNKFPEIDARYNEVLRSQNGVFARSVESRHKIHIELYKRLWEQIIAPMDNRTLTAQLELQIAELI